MVKLWSEEVNSLTRNRAEKAKVHMADRSVLWNRGNGDCPKKFMSVRRIGRVIGRRESNFDCFLARPFTDDFTRIKDNGDGKPEHFKKKPIADSFDVMDDVAYPTSSRYARYWSKTNSLTGKLLVP